MYDWIRRIGANEKKIYSQAGQDGALEYIFQHIGTVNEPPFYVEFGYNSNDRFGGSGANTAALHNKGWYGILFDGSYQNLAINLHKVMLTPGNIGDVFRRHQVPREPDFVSIDVDSIDLWLFDQMLREEFRPRAISVEYNSNIPIEMAITCAPDGGLWEDDRVYGASLKALVLTGKVHGYTLIHVIKKLDAIFVRDDLLKGAPVRPLGDFAHAILTTHNPAKHEKGKRKMMDYEVWLRTHDIVEATEAAQKAHKYL